ncbi:MAG: tail fiber domain-containing protein [Flavobacterium sp.]
MKKAASLLLLSFVILSGKAQTGIGTTTPVNKLQVETATADPVTTGAATNGNFRLSGSTGIHVLDFGLSSSSTYSWLQARSKSAYGTNYNLALNPNGGNVGIGTTNPTAKLNVSGGGIRIFNGFANNVTRPALSTSTIGNYEIRGVGAGGGSTQADGSDDGFLRLSAGGGTSSNTQSSIDLTGYSTVADMSSNIAMRTAGAERLRIDNAGNVGIGTITPTTKLYVNGDITANSVAGTSDIRFKTNIRPVTNALDKVKALQGVYFNWNQKTFPEKEFGAQDELGFIAQEVEKIVPEIVVKEKTKEEYRSVKYDKLVALLVEAIKEQQKQIESLQTQVKQLAKTRKK